MRLTLITALCVFIWNAQGAVMIPDKRWPNGTKLNVWFLDGTSHWHQMVKSSANTWSQYGNIRFQYFTQKPEEGSHIRISFQGYDGTQFGKHSTLFSNSPTMQLKSITSDKLTLEYKKRIILHEFGHALGFEHEYRHPDWPYGTQWLKHQIDSCESRLSKHSPDAKTHCRKINSPLSKSNSWWYPFDPQSIMNYPVPAQWLDHRSLDILPAMTLSPLDKIALSASYPFQISVEKTPIIQFINHCPNPLTVQWYGKTTQDEFSKIHRISLQFQEKSQLIYAVSDQVMFKAITRNGQFRWQSDTQENDYLIYKLAHWESKKITIPLYCQ